MNQATRTIFMIIGAILAGTALLLAGVFIGRSARALTSPWAGNMMGENVDFVIPGFGRPGSLHPMGPGMMGSFGQALMCDPGYGYGMMGQGMMGSGMMGALDSSGLLDVTPLSLDDAQQAVEDYLIRFDNTDLEVGEIMVFDNHAYAQIVEKSTGIGAMEVLVDPVTRAVYPEHGPNMMWNLKYSPMSGYGRIGMMGRFGQNLGGMMGERAQFTPPEEISAGMPVSPEQATEAAQEYLDTYLPGAEADDHADAFYGYYTLHIFRDGDVVGMLSVNGFTRQVFPHTWHGEFLEMTESNHN